MAHLSDGTLRRKFDDAGSMTESENRHYSACADCQARYATLADDAQAVAGALAVPDLKVDVASAFSRVRTASASQPRFGIRLPIVRPASRPVMGVLAAAAVVLALVVTGIAQGLFFHPQSVQVVPVSVADLQSLNGLGDFGTLTWTTTPAPQLVTSAAEAASVSGLHVPAVGKLPSGVSSNVTYAAMPTAVGVFTFDATKAAATAARAGKTLPAMPTGMNGSKLTVTVGPAVIEIFGKLNIGAGTSTGTGTGATTAAPDLSQLSLPELVVGESSAPVVTSSGVTTQQLEDYLLSLPGVSSQLAAAIRAVKDPSTTLPIPIPIEYATSKTVKVQGVNGVAVGDNTGLGAGVIWIRSGTVYGVAGTLKQDAILNIANGLK
ncbi:MAG TPA: hypothetical protein VND96_03250 [Candidatus Micrarchaeaceae archaeon]|nr:hypothetical protein [Candidatus Micrarchaeaceae archaeon]